MGPEQPETVQNFVSVFGTVAKKLMRKWLATQTMNFTSQLEAGIRFFDLRISTKPRDPENELFFAHGLFSATVSPVSVRCNDHPNAQTERELGYTGIRVGVKQTKVREFFRAGRSVVTSTAPRCHFH